MPSGPKKLQWSRNFLVFGYVFCLGKNAKKTNIRTHRTPGFRFMAPGNLQIHEKKLVNIHTMHTLNMHIFIILLWQQDRAAVHQLQVYRLLKIRQSRSIDITAQPQHGERMRCDVNCFFRKISLFLTCTITSYI